MSLAIKKPSKVVNFKQGKATTKVLKNVKYTGELMLKLSQRYADDIAMYGHLSLIQFYDMVKNIPYTQDPKKTEFLQRPYYTLSRRGKGGDCDDKCIVMGSYLFLSEIPYRFVAVGTKEKGRLHHVITEALIDGEWIHLDPTYSYNTIGVPLHDYAKRMVIASSI